jgi:hypothetical protein
LKKEQLGCISLSGQRESVHISYNRNGHRIDGSAGAFDLAATTTPSVSMNKTLKKSQDN